MKRKSIPAKIRKRIYEKYGGRCAYCGKPIEYKEMQVDHMEPLAKGGADNEGNYMPACRTCNHYKSTLTVEQFRGQIRLLTKRLAERVYIYKLALRHGRIAENDAPVIFYFEKQKESPDVCTKGQKDKKLMNGKMYDRKAYEIMRSDYIKSLPSAKTGFKEES